MKSPLTSHRLQKPLKALQSHPNGLTPLELNQICQSTRASSDLSELRENGIQIIKTYEGMSPNGRKVYRYRLAHSPDEAHAIFDAEYDKVNLP